MKKIITPSGMGKTTELIIQSHMSGNVIVCYNKKECSRIKQSSIKKGMIIPPPISFQEFLLKEYDGTIINGFLIDNVDLFLSSLTDVPINIITMRGTIN